MKNNSPQEIVVAREGRNKKLGATLSLITILLAIVYFVLTSLPAPKGYEMSLGFYLFYYLIPWIGVGDTFLFNFSIGLLIAIIGIAALIINTRNHTNKILSWMIVVVFIIGILAIVWPILGLMFLFLFYKGGIGINFAPLLPFWS